MLSLRQQVDRIDLKMLNLLQQRTKLAGEIGQMKRRRGAVIYVPHRERELIARLLHASKGKPSASVLTAIYREILSGSRAAQGQGPIGLLKASSSTVLPAAQWCFGTCDVFWPQSGWSAIERGLLSGTLSLALVTGDDLARALRASKALGTFAAHFSIVGELPSITKGNHSLAKSVFIVTLRGEGTPPPSSRIVILIECNSTVNAIKSLLSHMPTFSLAANHLISMPGRRRNPVLALLASRQPVKAMDIAGGLLAAVEKAGDNAGLSLTILGTYSGTENHGG